MTRASQPDNPFAVRGIVEGFYGVYYTVPQRIDLIQFLGAHGFNHYLYGPKNDRQHRSRWREPYPPAVLDDFAATVAAATRAGVSFNYALSPGVTICYSSLEDFAHLTRKLAALYACGVRSFSLFLDDIAAEFQHPADAAAYSSYAAAHVDLCRRALDWLQTQAGDCELSMCPTHYHGRPPFDAYLSTLGAELPPEIEVYYTGPEVCSPTIRAQDARAFAEMVQRAPIIWDNYPVNDLAMQPELHLGPIEGRAPDLAAAVRGVVVNPMLQPEASKIPLLTWAEYLTDPAHYAPEAAWDRALVAVAGAADADALRLVAENAGGSCLGRPEAARLEALTLAALSALRGGAAAAGSPSVAALERYLVSLDEAVYHLRNRARNLALRADLLPWLERLENWSQVGRHALAALRAPAGSPAAERARRSLSEAVSAAQRHPKRIAGQVLAPLAALALAPAEARA